VDDQQLAEYLVGHALEFTLHNDYWPNDKGSWTVSCGDVEIANATHKSFKKGTTLMKCTFIAGPVDKDIGKFIHIAMSGQYSMRRAISENKPNAITCKDILTVPIQSRITTRSVTAALANVASTITATVTRLRGKRQGSLQIDESNNAGHAFVAFTAITQALAAAAELKTETVFQSPEPKTQREARKRPDAADWIQSEQAEYEKISEMGTLTFVPNHTIPKGTTTIPTKFSYKCKTDAEGNLVKKNARLCVRGDLQRDDEYSETFAPTSRFNTLRCVFATAAQMNHKLYQFDVRGAFCVSEIPDQDLYIALPPGYEAPPGHTAMLSKSLYGLRDAAYRFHQTLSTWMLEYGCEAIDADRTMFRYQGKHGELIICLYVDDGLVSTNSEEEYKIFITSLQERFELSTDDTEVSWYLGIAVSRCMKEGYVHLHQTKYIEKMLERFKMTDVKPVLTPLEVGARLSKDDQPDWSNTTMTDNDVKTIQNYQQLVGSLMYCLAWCHPEIAFAVQQVSKHMANPGPTHVKAAKRILAYLKGVKGRGITYRRSDDRDVAVNQLYGYADADHAGDIVDRISVTGYVLCLNGCAISWQSVKQDVVALSTAEAEYYAATACGQDVVAMRRILEGMGHKQVGPTPIGEDNMAAIYMSKSSAMYHKVKHVDVKVYKLREFVRDGFMKLYYIKTGDQVADGLTKSIPSPAFLKHCRVMAGTPPFKSNSVTDTARAA